MLLLDVNIVLAAHRADHPQHGPVRNWFDRLLAGGTPFTVPTIVWGSFLRLCTNRRVFDVPTPIVDAFDFVASTCARPSYLLTTPGPRHLDVLRRMCMEAEALGDLVPDAVLAAVAVEHDCEVVTMDRDFARFSTVRHSRPAGT